MKYVTVQELVGPDPEPMYFAVVKVPMRAGDEVLTELLLAVDDAVQAFEKTLPDHDWRATAFGIAPPYPARDDDQG